MDENHEMWQKLGLDLAKHDELMGVLGEFYPALYLSQKNRPKAMANFNFVLFWRKNGRES